MELAPASPHVDPSLQDVQGGEGTKARVDRSPLGPDYDGQIGHRYFDAGRYKADLVCKIDCDAYLIEHDMTPHYQGLLGNKQLGVGAVDDGRDR